MDRKSNIHTYRPTDRHLQACFLPMRGILALNIEYLKGGWTEKQTDRHTNLQTDLPAKMLVHVIFPYCPLTLCEISVLNIE